MFKRLFQAIRSLFKRKPRSHGPTVLVFEPKDEMREIMDKWTLGPIETISEPPPASVVALAEKSLNGKGSENFGFIAQEVRTIVEPLIPNEDGMFWVDLGNGQLPLNASDLLAERMWRAGVNPREAMPELFPPLFPPSRARNLPNDLMIDAEPSHRLAYRPDEVRDIIHGMHAEARFRYSPADNYEY